MDFIELFLSVIAALSVGALLTLIIDTYFLGRQLQTVLTQKNKLQKELLQVEKRLATSRANVRSLARDLDAATARNSQLTDENQTLREKLEATAAEVRLLQDNLNRLGNRIDQLETRNESLTEQLATAAAELQTLHEKLNQANSQIGQLQEENRDLVQQLQTAEMQKNLLQENLNQANQRFNELHTENQQLHKRLAVADVEIEHLRDNLEEAREWVERAEALRAEKEALQYKFSAAESRISELKAQVVGVLHQLTETQNLHKRLAGTEEELQTTQARIEALQNELDLAHRRLHYAKMQGRENLELIRGIGPVYARRLKEAGIKRFSDLAQQSPEKVRDIVRLKEWQGGFPEAWIAEAKELAAFFSRDGVFRPAPADPQPPTDLSQNDQ